MDIIKLDELAEQAGLGYRRPDGRYWIDAGFIDVHLERFAELVAAEEREECARLCEDLFLSDGEWCAKSIRARNVSTKSQNVDTFAERVHISDKSIHKGNTSDMAYRPNGLKLSKPWVSLTEEEIENLELPDNPTVKEFVRFIEFALKRKNK